VSTTDSLSVKVKIQKPKDQSPKVKSSHPDKHVGSSSKKTKSATKNSNSKVQKSSEERIGKKMDPSGKSDSKEDTNEASNIPTKSIENATPVPKVASPPPPVVRKKEFTQREATVPTQVYTPPESENLINSFIYSFFGKISGERDAKWSKPWKTHEEHTSAAKVSKKTVAVDTSSGFIGEAINKFVITLFGNCSGERDPKWASSWKTHQEHKRAPEVRKKKNYAVDTSVGFVGQAINKFVITLFGNCSGERDPKWSLPWRTHQEHKRAPVVPKKRTAVDTSSGFIGQAINKFVITLFGNCSGQRDPKWAKPWQTHEEHQKKFTAISKAKSKTVNVAKASGGIIHSFITLVFPNPSGKRDDKYAQPWQTHEEQQSKFQSTTKENKKYSHKSSGGFLDSLIRIIFPTPLGKRHAKYATPWQKHDMEQVDATDIPIKIQKAKAIGGPIDSMINVLFNVDAKTKRDPKYAQPWKTHSEHADKQGSVSSEEKHAKVVNTGALPGFGFIDKIVTSVFDSVPRVRDEKWAEPWQRHAEHKRIPITPSPESNRVKVASGGIIDNFVKSLFGIGKLPKRDEKWSKPWQTHSDSVEDDDNDDFHHEDDFPSPPVISPTSPPTVPNIKSSPSLSKQNSKPKPKEEVQKEKSRLPKQVAKSMKFQENKTPSDDGEYNYLILYKRLCNNLVSLFRFNLILYIIM